jgi:hypothetical protein
MQIASLWIGPRLGPLEQLSALSFLETGHDLTLYSYGPVEGCPKDVRLADANDLLLGPIVRHKKTGSPALHSDLFRFQLIKQTGMAWVDLDILALKNFPLDLEYIFAWENSDNINGAVLKLPVNSSALQEVMVYDRAYKGYPPFLSKAKKFKYMIKTLGLGMTLAELPWGSIGPIGLTYCLKKTGEIEFALPQSSFYPVPLEQTASLLATPAIERSDFQANVYGIHFWGSKMRKIVKNEHGGKIPEHSFMGKEISRIRELHKFDIGFQLD